MNGIGKKRRPAEIDHDDRATTSAAKPRNTAAVAATGTETTAGGSSGGKDAAAKTAGGSWRRSFERSMRLVRRRIRRAPKFALIVGYT